MLIAASLFARPDKPALTWVAVAGGLLPDLSLYLLVFWSLGVRGESTDKVFGENYFSADWQRIFSIDNSFFVWALVIAIGLYAKREWVWVLGVACIVHVLADFPLHHDDGESSRRYRRATRGPVVYFAVRLFVLEVPYPSRTAGAVWVSGGAGADCRCNSVSTNAAGLNSVRAVMDHPVACCASLQHERR